MSIRTNYFASVLLDCLLHESSYPRPKIHVENYPSPLPASSTFIPCPLPPFSSSSPFNTGFRFFLALFIVRHNPLSLSLSSPSFYKCFLLFAFGRACCDKDSLSDNRVSVKHKVYLLMNKFYSNNQRTLLFKSNINMTRFENHLVILMT